MTEYRLEGARRLRQTLIRAGGSLDDLKGANKKAAGVVAPVAKAGAPKRTGKLARNIRTGATKKAGIIRVGGSRVPYANPIHWGWRSRNIEANPWMTRAAQATEPAWTMAYMTEVRNAIDRIRGV